MKTEEINQQIRVIPDNYSSGIVFFGKSYSALVLIECVVVMAFVGGVSYLLLSGFIKTQPGLVIGIVGSLSCIGGKLALDGIYDEDLIHFLMNVISFKKNRRIVDFNAEQTCERFSDNFVTTIREKISFVLSKLKKSYDGNGIKNSEERK